MRDFVVRPTLPPHPAFGSKITADGDCSHEIKIHLFFWKERYDKHRQCIKKQRHHFVDKYSYSQSFVFSSSHVWI